MARCTRALGPRPSAGSPEFPGPGNLDLGGGKSHRAARDVCEVQLWSDLRECERRQAGRRPRGPGHRDGRGAISALPTGCGSPSGNRVRGSGCSRPSLSPRSPGTAGSVPMRPSVPGKAGRALPPRPGRPGQCLLVSQGPRRMDAGVSSALVPSCWCGEAGGAGSRGSRGSTLTWARRSAGSLGRRGLSWAHAPPGGSAFAHGHLRFPRNSRASGPPRPPPPWALEPPAPRFLHAAVLCGSRFLDNEPLTARSAASVTRRDPSFPFPRALALPTRAIPDRRDAEGIGRLVPVRGDRLARLTVCTVLAQTGAPHGPRTLVSLCGPPPAPLKGNLVLALAVGPGLPSR